MAARNFDAQQDASSHPIGQHHPIRVICIGAGYSGVMMSIIVEQKMKTHKVSFQVYEMNEDLGVHAKSLE